MGCDVGAGVGLAQGRTIPRLKVFGGVVVEWWFKAYLGKEWKDKSSFSCIDMTVDATKHPAQKLMLLKIATHTFENLIQVFT